MCPAEMVRIPLLLSISLYVQEAKVNVTVRQHWHDAHLPGTARCNYVLAEGVPNTAFALLPLMVYLSVDSEWTVNGGQWAMISE